MIKSLFIVGVTGTVLGSSDVDMSPQAKEEELCSVATDAKTEEARNRHLVATCHVLLRTRQRIIPLLPFHYYSLLDM
jgi:hypothetical protein